MSDPRFRKQSFGGSPLLVILNLFKNSFLKGHYTIKVLDDFFKLNLFLRNPIV